MNILLVIIYLLIGLIIAKIDNNVIKAEEEELRWMNIDTGDPIVRFVYHTTLWPIALISNIPGFIQGFKENFQIEYENKKRQVKEKRKR